MSAWTPEGDPVTSARDAVTTVEGSSFCVCATSGDVGGGAASGIFFRDTRLLRRCDLTLDGAPVEPLAVMTPDPYRAVHLGRAARSSRRTRSTVVVERDRRVGNGSREDLRLRNLGPEAVNCRVSLVVEADFADLFEVKQGRVQPRGRRSAFVDGNRLVLEQEWQHSRCGTVVEAPDATSLEAATAAAGESAGVVRFDVALPPQGKWSTTVLVRPVVDGDEVAPAFPLGRPLAESVPALRRARWQADAPVLSTPHEGLLRAWRRSQDDLGSLRIFDEDDPGLVAVAAGAPWFMALFGRDSLLTAYLALTLDVDLAVGTLRSLAARQGEVVDPVTEEEPGRILHEVRHEVRHGVESGEVLGGSSAYYGTADATPLFVVLLGEAERWGADPEQVAALLPHADRALRWIEEYGDRDGDGFVEYERSTDTGLENQGWKDSWDGVTHADGRIAEPPIALCEVQGYVYDAYRTRARLARQTGEEDVARHWSDRAESLRHAFNARFWLPERGWFALALDGDKRPVDSCSSNMGHCLWSGIVDADKASQVVAHLMSPQMFTGWGVRTLSSAMGAYDPVSYHNGSVWPHDNALLVAGMVRYGFLEEAQRLARALLEAAEAFEGRLPELFCGFDRGDHPEPVPYPTSCSPQAWAAATPVGLVRALLRLEPRMPQREVYVDPLLPADLLPFRVEGIRLSETRLDVEVTTVGTTLSVSGWESGSPSGASVGLPPP